MLHLPKGTGESLRTSYEPLKILKNIYSRSKILSEIHSYLQSLVAIYCSDQERELLALPVRFGGLGIEILHEISDHEYEASREITKNLVTNITNQIKDIPFVTNTKEIKSQIKRNRNDKHSAKLEQIKKSLTSQNVKFVKSN